jgi:hypothetical protein
MFPPRRHKERFFDNPHGDNLYSRADFVKHDLHWQKRRKCGASITTGDFTRATLSGKKPD